MNLERPLGSVIQGSLSQGLEVRLHADVSVEDMRVGKFLVVQGLRSRFFCMMTDVALGTTSPRILANPPEPTNTFLQEVLAGTGTYGTINLTPMLMFTPEPDSSELNNKKQVSNELQNSKPKAQNSLQLPIKSKAVVGWNCCP